MFLMIALSYSEFVTHEKSWRLYAVGEVTVQFAMLLFIATSNAYHVAHRLPMNKNVLITVFIGTIQITLVQLHRPIATQAVLAWNSITRTLVAANALMVAAQVLLSWMLPAMDSI